MAVLRWKHGKSLAQARDLMHQQLDSAGYADKVRWKDNAFSASVGWGAVLNIQGYITDDEAVLEKCGGAAGGTALSKIKEILQRLFPGGEVT